MIQQSLNAQMNKERLNHATYRAMSCNLESVNWSGSARWMKHASDEEQEHSDKFAAYLIDRNWLVQYDQLPPPVVPMGDDLVAYFTAALGLEQENTESIKTLYFQAENEEDPQTCAWLIWAIEEQTRSERELVDILLELQRVDKTGWTLLDAKYGA
jgi:ferritin